MEITSLSRPSEVILGGTPPTDRAMLSVTMAYRHALLKDISRNTRRAYRNEFDHLIRTICTLSHRHLEAVLKNLPKMIGPEQALSYRVFLLASTTRDGDPLSVATVRRKLAFASRLFREFKRTGFTKVNPFERLTYVAPTEVKPTD